MVALFYCSLYFLYHLNKLLDTFVFTTYALKTNYPSYGIFYFC